MSDKKKLTDKQELFCREYIVDLNATQACIRAGWLRKGCIEIRGGGGGRSQFKPRYAWFVNIDSLVVKTIARFRRDNALESRFLRGRVGG